MKRTYYKKDFEKLSFEDRVLMVEELLPDEFYSGQEKINYWVPENFDENTKYLEPTPPEIEEEENEKFELLIAELIEYLFIKNETIEFDLEEIKTRIDNDNTTFLNLTPVE